MQFDSFLKKCYYLLEQDMQDVPQGDKNVPQEGGINKGDAAKEIDDAGKKMEEQNKATQEGVVELIQDLVNALITENRAKNIKLTPSIITALKNIKNSTLMPEPLKALISIEDEISKLSGEYQPKE